MKILVVGGGGREHALCWSLARNPTLERLFVAPGNAGTAEVATPVALSASDVPGIVEFADRQSIDLTVVGPEAPLVAGVADELESRGMAVFGPVRDGARLEGSKAWARDLCERHGIPAPRSGRFDDLDAALGYLDELEAPFVIKADGLAAGKGVSIAEDRAEARRALERCLVEQAFGEAGARVVVQEFLRGREVSAIALTDGRHVAPLALAQDFKRALDGDGGPNTGGMGAYSPVPWVDEATEKAIIEDVLHATVFALEEEGIRYRGVIYAGLMLTDEGPKVLEFNCRFGDPETQVILPRLESNLGETLLACVEGNLVDYRLNWISDPCVGVVMASGGYPGPVQVGVPVLGLSEAAGLEGVEVFHSGTAVRDGKVVTAGGRVLTVTARGSSLEDARRRAYEACSLIRFEGAMLRTDIARMASDGTGGTHA